MFEGNSTAFWRVLEPTKWPQAPSWMSFSTLIELETCPRRWALAAADYSEIWNHRGYPSLPNVKTLEGTIVHLSLQKITNALVENNCPSLIDQSAILTLRQLGGYTAIITDCLERALMPYFENPRASPVLIGIRTRLIARIPELRMRIQRYLSRIPLEPRAFRLKENARRVELEPRHSLQYGTYSEIPLQSSKLGWRGIVDMLNLSATQCEIRDYKTGIPKQEHQTQLWIYALLWIHDASLNPAGRPVDRLVLSYNERDIEVASPNASELSLLENEINQRTHAACTSLQSNKPSACMSVEHCRYCTVRQLCEEYWHWLARHNPKDEPNKEKYMDIQIKLLTQHGPSSWDGEVECGPGMEPGTAILLRTENLLIKLRPDRRLRLLNVYVNMPNEDMDTEDGHDLIVVTTGSWSEMYYLPLG